MPISKIHRQRRGRNLAVAGLLVAFIVAAFLVTLVNMQGQVWSAN